MRWSVYTASWKSPCSTLHGNSSVKIRLQLWWTTISRPRIVSHDLLINIPPITLIKSFYKFLIGQAGTENTQPLPNPWGPRGAGSGGGNNANTTSTTTTNTTSNSSTSSSSNNQSGSTSTPQGMPSLSAMNNIFAQLMGGAGGAGSGAGGNSSSTSTTGNNSTTPGGAGGLGGLFGAPGGGFAQDYLQQMMQNPRQLDAMLNTPYMQSMFQMMANNPEMARMMVESSPQLAGNPELREQVTRSMPALMQQVLFCCFLFYSK